MGLDTVELVMEIEEGFGVSISDAAASEIETVGQVWRFLLRETSGWELPGVCLSAATFYSLRRGSRGLGVQQQLHPDTAIKELLPKGDERHFWQRLEQMTGFLLPPLRCPKWISGLSIAAIAAAWGFWICCVWRMVDSGLSGEHAVWGIAVFSLIGLVASVLWQLMIRANHSHLPPAGCNSMRDLVSQTLESNRYQLELRYRGETERAVWEKLRTIVSEQLGVAPDKIRPDSHFVHDLGC